MKVIKSASRLRQLCRLGSFTGPTAGHAPGCIQANLVVLPENVASEFREFCASNSAPCPLIEESNTWEAPILAPGSDIRTDLPKYQVLKNGVLVDECTDILSVCTSTNKWHSFLLGCSFSWEDELASYGYAPRHVTDGTNVPMYVSSIPLNPSSNNLFGGTMVVSMRPYLPSAIEQIKKITSRYPAAHGA